MDSFFPIEVTEGRILFGIIRTSIRAANYNYSKKNERAILIWYDTIKDTDYFSNLHPWQVVNRLPSINIICRKAPLVRLIQRIQPYFPQLYDFLPKSFILPIQNVEFNQLVSKHEKKYIIKTDNGSLGLGITIIDEKKSYKPVSHLSIGQEYIESCLVDQTKFDCRIYVLVTSIENLQIYVYRGGVARFCSQKSGSDSIYSQVTNTHINRKNPGTTIDKITRMVTDTFEQLSRKGVDIELLWKKIDKIATLTILSAYSILANKEKKACSNYGYPRCFQILGFDILIDNNNDPKLLEVNYRPSLDRETDAEGKMKCEMLSEAMKIAVPLNEIQKRISKNKINYNENGWRNFLKANPTIMKEIEKQRNINLKESHFVQAYPSSDPQENSLYKEVIQKVESLPTATDKKYRLPLLPSENDTTENHPVKLPPINNNRSNSNDTVYLQLNDSINENIKKSVNFNTKVETNVVRSPRLNFLNSEKLRQSNTKTENKIEKSSFLNDNKSDTENKIEKSSYLNNNKSDTENKIEKSSFLNNKSDTENKIEKSSFLNNKSDTENKIEKNSYLNNNKSDTKNKKIENDVTYFQLNDLEIKNEVKINQDDQESSEDYKYYILTEPDNDSYDESEPIEKEKNRINNDDDDKRSNRRINTDMISSKSNNSKSANNNNNNIKNDTIYFILDDSNTVNQKLGNNIRSSGGSYLIHEPVNIQPISSEKSYLPRLNQSIKSSPSSNSFSPNRQFDQKNGIKDPQKRPFSPKKYSLNGH